MRWVQQPAIRPHRCAVIPFIGAHNATGGFIDTGQDMRDPDSHVYISVQAVEEMARFIGWAPPDAVLRAKCERLTAQVDELEADLAEADKFRVAAEYTLSSFGSKVRNKPGRKVAA